VTSSQPKIIKCRTHERWAERKAGRVFACADEASFFLGRFGPLFVGAYCFFVLMLAPQVAAMPYGAALLDSKENKNTNQKVLGSAPMSGRKEIMKVCPHCRAGLSFFLIKRTKNQGCRVLS
jgi:hypothetical protein